mmetsp:Transcript_27839/g.89981  ORF Transcript_27839/g.89981 Transcript_27839/m.89981 type:complete len:179 (-) Transcript_27839:1604-2140(-)
MCGLRLLRFDSPNAVAWAPRAVHSIAAGLGGICLLDFSSAYFGSSSAGHFALGCSLCSWFIWFAQVRAHTSSLEATIVCLIAQQLVSRSGRASGRQTAWWHRQPLRGSALMALAFAVRPNQPAAHSFACPRARRLGGGRPLDVLRRRHRHGKLAGRLYRRAATPAISSTLARRCGAGG